MIIADWNDEHEWPIGMDVGYVNDLKIEGVWLDGHSYKT